jgi:hypothetical protein
MGNSVFENLRMHERPSIQSHHQRQGTFGQDTPGEMDKGGTGNSKYKMQNGKNERGNLNFMPQIPEGESGKNNS